jgi:hypothetical protein
MSQFNKDRFTLKNTDSISSPNMGKSSIFITNSGDVRVKYSNGNEQILLGVSSPLYVAKNGDTMTGDLTISSISGAGGEIVILTENGTLQNSGLTISDISGGGSVDLSPYTLLTTTASISADLNSNIQTISSDLNDIYTHIIFDPLITDWSSIIQQKITDSISQNKNYIILHSGIYDVSSSILLPSNITLIGYGATIRRNDSTLNNIFRNNNTTVSNYSGNKNINVFGINFDNNSLFNTQCTTIAFGHCENIKILNCSFINGYDWHAIELNASKNCLIENCNFSDFAGVDQDEEMIQIDLMKGAGQYPWETGTTIYDSTPCENIKINKCYFNNGATAIGSHSETIGKLHKNIIIENCTFENMDFYGIKTNNWTNVKINNCYFNNMNYGIVCSPSESSSPENLANWKVTNCHFNNINVTADTGRAIQFVGLNGFTPMVENVNIDACSIKLCSRHAIGFDYCKNISIENCYIDGCDRVGIYIFRSHETIIDSCVVINSGAGAISTERNITIGSDTATTLNTQNVIVSNCIVDDISIRRYCTRTNISNNIIKTNNSSLNSLAIDTKIHSSFINNVWVDESTNLSSYTLLTTTASISASLEQDIENLETSAVTEEGSEGGTGRVAIWRGTGPHVIGGDEDFTVEVISGNPGTEWVFELNLASRWGVIVSADPLEHEDYLTGTGFGYPIVEYYIYRDGSLSQSTVYLNGGVWAEGGGLVYGVNAAECLTKALSLAAQWESDGLPGLPSDNTWTPVIGYGWTPDIAVLVVKYDDPTAAAVDEVRIGNGRVRVGATPTDNDDVVRLVDLSGYAAASHTHSVATSAADGFMSFTDKIKLDSLNNSSVLYGRITTATPLVYTNTNFAATVNRIHEVQASTTNVDITLPDASTCTSDVIIIKSYASTSQRIRVLASQSPLQFIDHQSYFTMSSGGTLVIYSTGSHWRSIVREPAARFQAWFQSNAGQVVNSTSNNIQYEYSVLSEVVECWNGSMFTAPLDGAYTFSLCIRGTASAGSCHLYALDPGSSNTLFTGPYDGSETSGPRELVLSMSCCLNLTYGSQISFRVAGANVTRTTSYVQNDLHIGYSPI